jgi:hypothetical protein
MIGKQIRFFISGGIQKVAKVPGDSVRELPPSIR